MLSAIKQLEQHKQDILYILLFGAIIYFSGNNILAVTDPVESNYTLTAKEMIEANDYISPRICGNYWYDKPIFFYWELILAFKLFGISDFAARFFPVCFSLTALVMTYLFARKLYNEKVAFCSAMVMASSVGYWYLSKAIITDMSLFVFHSAVLMLFYIGYKSKQRNFYYLCYVAAAFATLTKGPVGLLLPGLTIIVFLCIRKDFKEILRLKWIPGLVLYLAIGAPWYYQMYTLHGMDFINGFFGTHNVLRATVSEHPRDNVWWYYIMIFAATFVPWTFLLFKARPKIFTKSFWTEMPEEKIFLLVWAFTVIVCYNMAATKYPTYIFPSTLPLAILFGLWLQDKTQLVKRISTGMAVFFIFMGCVAVPIYIRENVSGITIASQLNNVVPKEALLTSYGSYRVSQPYYSGRTVYRLETLAGIEGSKPSALSWNIKNIMPFFAIENLPKDKPTYILVNKNSLKSFNEQFKLDKYNIDIVMEDPTTQLVRLYVK